MGHSSTEAADRQSVLLDQCRAGDAAAWKELYNQNFGFVYRTARRLGAPSEQVEDVVHEVFVVAFRKLHKFEQGRFTTWLYRICANVVSDQRRRLRVRQAFRGLKVWVGAPPPETPERAAQRASAKTAVERVMACMAPKKREVLALFELEGLSGDEIAERVDCPVDTVWTRLHHARKEFAKHARRMGVLDEEVTT